MKNFLLGFSESSRILKRHRFLTAVLIIQCILCLSILGTVYSHTSQSNQNINNFNRDVTDKYYYCLHENLNDDSFYRFMHKESAGYKEIAEFLNSVLKDKKFTYVIAVTQPISIYNKSIPDKFLDSYETGDYSGSTTTDENKNVIKSVKSLQVSKNFFKEFNIKLKSGHFWTDKDFVYPNNKVVPVILGSEYQNVFHLGDELKGEYLFEKMTFKVVGFLDGNAAYSSGYDTKYCDRYILIPQFNAMPDNATDFNKMRLLQSLCGFTVTDKSFSETKAEIASLLNSAGVSTDKYSIFLTNPLDTGSSLEEYKAMTKEVSKQFTWVLIILTLFVVISTSVTVNGFIRESHYEYGVLLLNGAKWSDIVRSVIILVGSIIVLSDVFSVLLLIIFQKYDSILYTQAITALILILSCVFPVWHVKRMDISNLIGGKE